MIMWFFVRLFDCTCIQSKNPAPSYPQGLVVTAPGVDGLYVVATNNKEDVWVTKVRFESLVQ
jgi:hypothetical protein